MLFRGANSILNLNYENLLFWVLSTLAIGGTIVAIVYRYVFRLANYNYKLIEYNWVFGGADLRIKRGN